MSTVAAPAARRTVPPRWTELVLARSSFLALAVLAAAGIAVLDDYGVGIDELAQRDIGIAAVGHVLGDDDALGSLVRSYDRFYGVVFEAPLLLIERLLGLEDSRAFLLNRHLLIHLFFLTGGLAASLLAYRLCRSRWLALFALLVFVLHPRLYAHSFLNSKDIPFLAMFMVALYLVHRAFRQGGPGAFAACGAAVGVLTNLRVMGVLVLAAVLALRALDLVQAGGRAARRRVLASAGVFVLASALTLYAVSPLLWSDPLELIDAFATLSRHPYQSAMLFQGETIRWPEIPAHYLPTWITITTPPVVLLLGLAGMAAVVHRALTRPGEALRNTDARFELLLAACPILTILAIVAANMNVYDGWRHVYFLYAPMSLLAVLGLRGLLELRCIPPVLRTGVPILAGAGLAWVVAEMVLIHPNQSDYFNLLVDRRTPEYLRTRYPFESRGAIHRQGLEHLLRRFPSGTVPVLGYHHTRRNLLILPEADRRRILLIHDLPLAGGFYLSHPAHALRRGRYAPPFAPVVHARKVHDNTVLMVTALDPSLVDEATAEAYREIYRSTTRGTPVVRSDFDLHLDANTLTWVKESCRPADVRGWYFFLGVVPVDVEDLPRGRRGRGFDNLPFEFPQLGVHVDDACMMRRPLPDYPIRSVETGQRGKGGRFQYDLWRAAIALSPEGGVTAAADVYREAYRAAAAREPVVRSYFDLHLHGNAVTWIRESCSPKDTWGRIFVHATPVDRSALPTDHRRRGFEALDFEFRRGPWQPPRIAGRFDGRCLASVALPEYPLAGLRTGQIVNGARVWEAELTFPGGSFPGPGPAEPGDRPLAARGEHVIRSAAHEPGLDRAEPGPEGSGP